SPFCDYGRLVIADREPRTGLRVRACRSISDHAHQVDTAAAAFSPTSCPARKRAGENGSMSFGVLPVAMRSAMHLPAIGGVLKPYVPQPTSMKKFSTSGATPML